MTKQGKEPRPPSRSNADDAFTAAKREIARRNDELQTAAVKHRRAREGEAAAKRRIRDLT